MGMSLIFIWSGAVFWSGAPLLGWGSYTGEINMASNHVTCYLIQGHLLVLGSCNILVGQHFQDLHVHNDDKTRIALKQVAI